MIHKIPEENCKAEAIRNLKILPKCLLNEHFLYYSFVTANAKVLTDESYEPIQRT